MAASETNIPILEDFEFVHPPAPTPWGWIAAGAVAAVLIVIAGLLLVRWWRERQRRIERGTRPHRTALGALEAAFGRWREEGYLYFLFQVTRILRVYLSERFEVQAPCRTTTEIAQAVASLHELSAPARERLNDLLGRCDRIKFAALQTVPDEVEGLYQSARGFVRETFWRP
jgi:hypothetical protein